MENQACLGIRGRLYASTVVLILAIAGCNAPITLIEPSIIPPVATERSEPERVPSVLATNSQGSSVGVLKMAMRSDPPHYDVHQTFAPTLHRTGPGLVYSRLLRFRSGEDIDSFSMQLECDLCETWERVDDSTYRFVLRSGVRWHDLPPVNGRKLTVEDVVFSYERQRTPGWDNANLLRDLESVARIDDHTLEVKAHHPDADFLAILAHGHSKIVPREAVEELGDLRDGIPIGTGPWQWMNGIKAIAYNLERNPNYYEEGLPRIDRLGFQVIPDARTRFAALLLGTLDVAEIPPSEVATITKKYPGMELLEVPHYGHGVEMVINTGDPAFQDLKMRQAVFQALDPWRYLETVWQGGIFTGLGMPLVSNEWLLPLEDLRTYWGDYDEAIELLHGAPLSLLNPFDVTVADYGDAHLDLAEVVLQDLKAVGFDARIRQVNPVQYVDQVWGVGDYAIYLGPQISVAKPNDYFLGILHSAGGLNNTHYRNIDLDQLLEEQAVAFDPLKRRQLVLDIQRRLLRSAVRFALVTDVSSWAWQPRIKDLHLNLAGYEYFYHARIGLRAD